MRMPICHTKHMPVSFVMVGSDDNMHARVQHRWPPGHIKEQMNERYKIAFRLVKFIQNCVHSNARV